VHDSTGNAEYDLSKTCMRCEEIVVSLYPQEVTLPFSLRQYISLPRFAFTRSFASGVLSKKVEKQDK
jgi:hypothetical protein